MVTVILHSSQIYRRGGMANRWFGLLTDNFTRNVEFYAPVRSGELQSMIWGEHYGVGVEMEAQIHSDAPHTMFVIDGTEGPIMSDGRWDSGGVDPESLPNGERSGMYLKLRPGEGWSGGFAKEVSGQASNNFMLKGWAATGRQHSSVRGATPILFR